MPLAGVGSSRSEDARIAGREAAATALSTLDGAASIAGRPAQLEGRTPIIALSLECSARPRALLGDEEALREVVAMQGILGGHIPWFGSDSWGGIAPVGDRTCFHNHTFPLAMLVRRSPGP